MLISVLECLWLTVYEIYNVFQGKVKYLVVWDEMSPPGWLDQTSQKQRFGKSIMYPCII